MLNLNSFVLFSQNPKVLIDFYTKVFQLKPDWAEGELVSWTVGASFFTIGPHSQVKGKSKEPVRMMCIFETNNVEKEVERIKALGAKVIAEPYHPQESPKQVLATLADPDGNTFQLETPIK